MKPLAASVLLAAAGAAAGCGGEAQTAIPAARGVPVRVAEVEQRDLTESLLLTGTLRPRAQVELLSEVSARLLRVLREEGASVAKGETLALLDEIDYRLAHERAQAALVVAEANRAHALVEQERADNLRETGGITDRDHLAARVRLQVAEAGLAQARAEAAIAAEQRARCEIKAPFAGRVARRHVDAGAMLAPRVPVFTLVDDSVLEFRASVPSADFGRVRVGAAVEVRVDALPGAAIPGRVGRIAPLVEERTRSFEAVVEVPGGPGLVGGLFARANVRVGQVGGALTVPPAALVRDGGSEAVAFVVVSGKVERRQLALGVETSDAVQVRSGLAAGERVVLDPPVALGDGAPVEVQRAAGK